MQIIICQIKLNLYVPHVETTCPTRVIQCGQQTYGLIFFEFHKIQLQSSDP